MKSRIKGLFAVVIVLSGVIVGSITYPDESLAQQTGTYTGKIDFDMRMDDGSLIPAGKVPVAKVEYAVRTIDQEWLDNANIVYQTDAYANPETITIPYNGAGNYSFTKPAQTWNYGTFQPSSNPPYRLRGWTYYHLFRRLNFTNVPAYIRTISAKSSVLGDYSRYTLAYDTYISPTLGGVGILEASFSDDNTSIKNANLTRVSQGNFSYQGGPPFGAVPEFDPNTVEFAVTGGRPGTSYPSRYAEQSIKNSSAGALGRKITFFMKGFQTTEQFMDPDGGWVPAPPGFTQNKTTDANDDHFTHTMNKLPTSYESGGNLYVLQGWHQKYAKPAILEQSNPPSITVDYNQPKTISQLDEEGYIRVIYAKAFAVKEKYVDSSNTSIDSGSWDTVNPVANNGNFTGTPAATKTDSSGAIWEYQGWKEGISGTVNGTAVPVTINNITGNKDIYYIYKKKLHAITRKYVDHTDGTTLLQIPSNPNTSWKNDGDLLMYANPTSQTDTNGDVWDYVGWENVTDAPGIVNPTSTPISISSIKGPKELRYHYQTRKTTATLDLKPTPQIVDSGDTVSWSSKLTNTGASDLKDLVLKSTSNWAAGLTDPVKVTVTPAGGAPQDFTVNSGDWATGVNLTGISIPKTGPNNYADITFTTTATGAANQVLPAEIEVDGNIPTPLKAENFVRIDDQDEPNLLPSGNSGLLNIPNFKFGEVEVKPFAQRKGLDSSEYANPSYNPYIRYMDNESIGTYSLSVKMGPFTSGSKTLPAATSIILGTGTVKEVQNYNKPNETLSAGSSIGPMRIESDNTTSIIHLGNTQGVYQIDYDFNDVELDLVAHSGIAGLDYKAVMDWTLTTAP
ncbi:hypothetical protein [Enterococcus hulanensis]|uniref:hypothetical protein n=1 Tax=Enterococcus hulanensis TaxID=2559929 RepID=UPI0010F57569|nr:hypothetical protein [Enterococcus hulanensis]